MKSARGSKATKLDKHQMQDDHAQVMAIRKAQPVVVYDMDGMVLDINENFEKILGYSSADVLGKHASMFVDDVTRQSAQYQASLKDQWIGCAGESLPMARPEE